MNAFDRLAAPPPAISTNAELLQRLKDRPRPELKRDFTPNDANETEIKEGSAHSNEQRIAFLRSSLDRATAMLLHDQAKARLQGFARSRFDIER